ncbi:MAG: hypothetical protein ACYTG6_15600 [Planctomycetota bacterium]|jgi:predicted HicB family RNase H-like nuclease
MAESPDSPDQWIEKARLRLAECEAEQRRGAASPARAQKLADRSERYRGLIEHLRGRPRGRKAGETTGEETIAAIEAELLALKERILNSAASLVHDKERLKELKKRWGLAADAHLTALENAGRPPERLVRLDFAFHPPPQGASTVERAAHQVIRSLGL